MWNFSVSPLPLLLLLKRCVVGLMNTEHRNALLRQISSQHFHNPKQKCVCDSVRELHNPGYRS